MTARWELIEGDCVEVMRGLEAGSFHAIVTDPPYGIEFMGHAWDTFKGTRTDVGRVATHVRKGRAFEAFSEEWAREAYRLLAPGGYLVAFGAPRLYHRLACGLEEAGFYVSDALLWLYGQGFPKSLNVAMAIDKRAGVEVKPSAYVPNGKNAVYGSGMGGGGDRTGGPFPVGGTPYEPVTDEARAWLGFGTGLKPAWEGAAVARKPLACSSVAANVLEHGAGALNVDACRIPVSPDDPVHDAVWTSRPSTVRPGTRTRLLVACGTCDATVPAFMADECARHASSPERCGGACINGKRTCNCRCKGRCHGAGRCSCGEAKEATC